MQLLDKRSCKFDEFFTILSGGGNVKTIKSLKLKWSYLVKVLKYWGWLRSGSNLKSGSIPIFQIFYKIAMVWWNQYVNPDLRNDKCKFQQMLCVFEQVMGIYQFNPDPHFQFLCIHGAW